MWRCTKTFFGEWTETILQNSFIDKMHMKYFKKLEWNGENVGFLGYDLKEHMIDNVFIRIIPKAQKNGIGTWFLNELKELSEQMSMPVFLTVIQTNPARYVYQKMEFQCYKKQDVFEFYRYDPLGGRREKHE